MAGRDLKASEGELIRLSDPKITNVRVLDLRFPTSRHQIGSDAVNTNPDYSAAYCILETNEGVEGYGLAFTLGHGTELCVLALEYLARFVRGRNLSSLTDDTVAFSRQLTEDSQFRWLGAEKGGISSGCRSPHQCSLGPLCANRRQASLEVIGRF